MIKHIVVSVLIIFFLSSCGSKEYDKLKISATTWIGYTPLLYAKEKGWLEPYNIKILHVSSLAENMYLYKAGNADAYVGTQYEYSQLIEGDKTLMPIMMFDRSYGGDMIMSNVSVEDLKSTTEKIDAYLEMDSINLTVLEDFLKQHQLDTKSITYLNNDQAAISNLNAANMKKPALIITYVPYDTQLKKQGFHEIASTKDGLDLLVVDALFTTQEKFYQHKEQFVTLKSLVDKAIAAVKNDPKEFYETVKHYMLEIDYDEFLLSLNDIIWINETLEPALQERMKQGNFPTRDLL